MTTVIPGHSYKLQNFDQKATGQLVQFIHKVPGKKPGTLQTIQDGTTNEEVLKMLIDRTEYIQHCMPCRENAMVLTKLEEALMWLERRTANRRARSVEGKNRQ